MISLNNPATAHPTIHGPIASVARRVTGFALAAALASGAQAGVTLNAARIGGTDVGALEKFYESAFGLKEINRLHLPNGQIEVMLNFGSTLAAAKANHAAQIAIMHRDSNDLKDPVPHLILNVTNMSATVAAVKAAGGSVQGTPRAFGNTGIVVGFAVDPDGNRIEMLQQPGH